MSEKKSKKSKKEKKSKKSRRRDIEADDHASPEKVVGKSNESGPSEKLRHYLKEPENELWLIRAPKKFDPSQLVGKQLSDNQILQLPGKDGQCSYKIETSGASPYSQLVCFVPDGSGGMSVGKPFLKQVNILDHVEIPNAPTEMRLSGCYKGVPQKEELMYSLKPAGFGTKPMVNKKNRKRPNNLVDEGHHSESKAISSEKSSKKLKKEKKEKKEKKRKKA